MRVLKEVAKMMEMLMMTDDHNRVIGGDLKMWWFEDRWDQNTKWLVTTVYINARKSS